MRWRVRAMARTRLGNGLSVLPDEVARALGPRVVCSDGVEVSHGLAPQQGAGRHARVSQPPTPTGSELSVMALTVGR